ncbi:GNAT family N-acetyltransferase [Hymenobacter crusticola]|uniref:N-acetyltransferase domain-containing protein n=1 Tax=Hymenobacter crusticola TaxID=1770526 RepID=A0A243W7P4_9BACT|nr:hypothetical protein BXP70_23105 [Hymenobacter crusticola]
MRHSPFTCCERSFAGCEILWLASILAVERASSPEFVGLIALNLGKVNFKNAEGWHKFLPSYWGQGLTTEALNALLNYGFDYLQLHRIEAGCAVENVGSTRVLKKVGMILEGRKRRGSPVRGTWVNNYLFAILDTDWATIREG